MFSGVKQFHLQLTITDFTKTLLCLHTQSIIWCPTSFKTSCFLWSYRGSHCFLSPTTFDTFLYPLFKRACTNMSSNAFFREHLQRRKDGQFTDQATLDWSAFMPLRVGFTVCLPNCSSVSPYFPKTSHQTVYLWIIQLILHQDTAEPPSRLLHPSSFYAKVQMSSVLHGATSSILKACWAQDIPGKKSPVLSYDLKVVTVTTVHSIDSK